MAQDDFNPAKILFWDVETSSIDLKVTTYSLKNYNRYFHYDTVQRDWTMLGASWAFNDEPVKCMSVSSKDPLNDYELVVKLHGVLSQADVLVAHNGDAFDLKKFNSRAIFHGLEPLPPLKHTVDTLKVCRSVFKFTSNSLGFLCQHLKLEHQKTESPDWDKILQGDVEELSKMRFYNRLDVEALRSLFYRIRPWIKNHPNLLVYNKVPDLPKGVCTVCGSHDTRKEGFQYSRTGKSKKQKYFCKSHKGWFT